jgi:hypothetical protein
MQTGGISRESIDPINRTTDSTSNTALSSVGG